MKNILFLLAFIVILSGCDTETNILFDEPQPANGRALKSLPKKLQGEYMSDDHTEFVTITDNLIRRTFDFYTAILKDSIGSDYKLRGNTLIENNSGDETLVKVTGDSIFFRYYTSDTLFAMSHGSLIKIFKGYYFLNTRKEAAAWKVQKLALQKGILTFGSVSAPEDIDKLQAITETSNDTVSRKIHVSRKQFRTFIKQGGFSEHKTYRRIRREITSGNDI